MNENEEKKYEKYLPIGTVVLLKNGNKKVMITTYLIFPDQGKDTKMYDYGACTFPEGVIESGYAIAFNHDDIKEVVFLGCADDEQKRFSQLLLSNEEQIRNQFNNMKAEN